MRALHAQRLSHRPSVHDGDITGRGIHQDCATAGKQSFDNKESGTTRGMKRPAVFIDRDGTISEEVGYVNHPSRYRVFPYSSAAIKLLNERDWLAVLVTNQAGVARGYFTEDVITAVHGVLKNFLEEDGAKLDAIYYCAHHPSIGAPPY